MSSPATRKLVLKTARSGKFMRMFAIYVVLGLIFAFASQWLPVAEGGKRVLTRIWGPVLTDTYPTSGRDQITVMLIDDKDLETYAEVWPVSLGFHERRLLELLKYQPKAVFFDIVFLDDRKDPDLDGFIDAACRARRAGIPVFIGSFGNANFTPSNTESRMLARRVEVGGKPAPCIEAAYLNMKIDGYDHSVWEYDINVPQLMQDPEGGATRQAAPNNAPAFPSPAARLYQVDHTLDANVAAQSMALVWGTASDPRNLEWLNNDLRPGGPGAPCSASWYWYRVLPFGKATAPICPYQQLLPVRTLKGTHGLDGQQLDQAIRAKYVIYGTSLQSNGDVILAPYHGRIAGAFLHAIALDNLLSFEGKPKEGGDFGQPWVSRATVFTLIAVAIISALIAAKSLWSKARVRRSLAPRWLLHWQPVTVSSPLTKRDVALSQLGRASKACMLWMVTHLPVGALFLCVIAVLIGVSYYGLRLGPLVWIEYVLFPIGADFLQIGPKVDAALRQAYRYLDEYRGLPVSIDKADRDAVTGTSAP